MSGIWSDFIAPNWSANRISRSTHCVGVELESNRIYETNDFLMSRRKLLRLLAGRAKVRELSVMNPEFVDRFRVASIGPAVKRC